LTAFDHKSIPAFWDSYRLHFPQGIFSHAGIHAQLSVLYGESPAFYPPSNPQKINWRSIDRQSRSNHRMQENFLKKVFKRAQHLAPSGVLTIRGQDVAFIMKLAGVTQWHY
jgi:hypothetical protein